MSISTRIAAPWTITLAAVVSSPASGGPRYTIIDLTEVAARAGVAQSEARAINEAGQIVGFEVVDDFHSRAVFWPDSRSAQILSSLPGDNSTVAIGVAETGVVLGLSSEVTVQQQGQFTIIQEDQKASLWQDGRLTDLNTLVERGAEGVRLHFAQAMNDAGHIVGFAGLIQGPPFFSNGFLFEDGVVTDLGLLQRPVAINAADQIVGYTAGSQAKAYLWENGALTNLHLHPSITGVTSRAFNVNDSGLIVGEAQFHISKPEEPTLWQNLQPIRLIPDVNRPQGQAWSVNSRGQIVGVYFDLDDLNGAWRGFLWENGDRVELLELIDPKEGWDVLFAFDINDAGQIVGGGMRNGQLGRAFVMTPVSGVLGDLNDDGLVNGVDLGILLSQWFGDGTADLNGDHVVNGVDLGILLANWTL